MENRINTTTNCGCGRICVSAIYHEQSCGDCKKKNQHATDEVDIKYLLGQSIYNYRCYFCHGYSGNAKTLAATYLSPPPIAFTLASTQLLTPQYMKKVIATGKKNTAMMSFNRLLSGDDIDAVVHFIRSAFMQKKVENTRYHTEENGWFNHEKYRIAFPFATGELPLDTKDEDLSEMQRKGKQLFFAACISCHDRSIVNEDGAIWEGRPLSWPRNNFSHKQNQKVDGVSGASSYALHDIENTYAPASEDEKKGQQIFQENCAFCHAPDGTGKHWIGQFLEPHPKNFTESKISKIYSKQSLRSLISSGKENTAMPAWRYVLTEDQIEYVISYMWAKFN